MPGYDSAPGGPKGYVVVESGTVTDWAGGQTHDEIVCPAGKVPLGGGAQLHSSSLGENLASSYPTTQGWAVDVNNATTADGLYDIYAVCANPPRTTSSTATARSPPTPGTGAPPTTAAGGT